MRLAALVAFVVLTNDGFMQRLVLLSDQHRWGTFVGFVGVWGLSLAALLVAAWQSNIWLRCGWALVIAFTTAVGFSYRHASGSELSVFDALSLWNARHEATRAAEFYTADLYWLALVFIGGFAVMAMPPVAKSARLKVWLTRLFWMPALPVLAIVAIVLVKEGGGSEVLPPIRAAFGRRRGGVESRAQSRA